MIRSFVMIGAGNLATNLGIALRDLDIHSRQVYNRSPEAGKVLAGSLSCQYIPALSALDREADLYIISVTDQAIAPLAAKIRVGEKIVIHTSGATGMEILDETSANTGVLYAPQTFFRDDPKPFTGIPLCIEGNNTFAEEQLIQLGRRLSDRVIEMNSRQRLALHLAATFACNFTNYLYAIAEKILRKNEIDMELLMPIILKTAENAMKKDVFSRQTGPAVREDSGVLGKHMDLLKECPDYREIYSLISQNIINHKHRNDKL